MSQVSTPSAPMTVPSFRRRKKQKGPPLVVLTAYDASTALAAEAGGERLLRVEPGRPPPYIGAGLVRFDGLDQSHDCQRDEIFGPEASLYRFDDFDAAIAAHVGMVRRETRRV